MRYYFSSVFNHGQTGITKGGEACRITYLHNAKGQRVFKSEHRAGQLQPNEAMLSTNFIARLKSNFSWPLRGLLAAYGGGARGLVLMSDEPDRPFRQIGWRGQFAHSVQQLAQLQPGIAAKGVV